MSSHETAPEDSLLHMDNATFNGLLAIGCLATVSCMLTSGLLGFISWRMVSWKRFYSSSIGYNQSIVLIYQLLLADFLQSLGFLISFYWATQRQIIGPSDACFVQGWLIQMGDVASAFFVLAIAVHTVYQVVFSKRVSHQVFLTAISSVWGLALLLTSLAPIIGGRFIFQRAGVWCWIKSNHEDLRLLLHYIWIFIIEFGSIAVYTVGFWFLYQAKKPGSTFRSDASLESLNKASRAMLAYAIAYTLLTLPLAAGRMASMSGRTLPDSYFFFAGSLFTSSGWVDSILYAFTRRSLLFQELQGPRPVRHSLSDQLRSHRTGFARQGSTDDILGEDIGGFGGIKLEKTVKVDVESPTSSVAPSHNYSVSAKRHTVGDEMDV
ncbi:G protein-coupled glucose receptor regulating Gpa2-domain-containing protein [Apiospora hydei]|uniref:G protein-coupled glucose receptor regulating Gpa2-domain-containing protein n=1 Tax=Apiospora hydei TaxID=1337664 RepID=A0ABR1WMK6_9PEZI